MSESISQGIPFLELGSGGSRLYKCNDISFSSLKRYGFNCLSTSKKPDQIVAIGDRILVGIEDKADSKDSERAVSQIKSNYLEALPNTKYFIARAGERTRVFFRTATNKIIEIGTTLKGKEVTCFGPRVISRENESVQQNLFLLTQQVLAGAEPVNGSVEIQPPKKYYNPLVVKQSTIYSLWQKIFVSTGENAHICLYTFVELLLYKGISDAGMLSEDYSIEALAKSKRTNSLQTYKSAVRHHIKTHLFPTPTDQPGVINSFAFAEQETVFKNVLRDLCDLGNLAQRQIDPDFKRRVIEAFLGSAHREGTIKSGKHLTPRVIIQAIWEMASPQEGKRIVDPACGVGGFVLEGLNYPYEFAPLNYNCLGIDRDEQMIITAKANMILHILHKFADPNVDREKLVHKINKTFLQATNNGTGTLGEIEKGAEGTSQFSVKHSSDYVFSNVPFYVNGVTQIVESLRDIGISEFYQSCGIGVESRFLKYILSQIKDGDPGLAFVIVTDGVLYRHKDKIRGVINANADVLGIVSLPVGCFQNNNWKTSILIFKRKTDTPEYSQVFLYDVENIGVSLDAYRTPIEANDIPGLKRAWERRWSGSIDDPRCRLVPRDEFLKTHRWSELFAWRRDVDDGSQVSFSEFIELAEETNREIATLLENADKDLGEVFALELYQEIALGSENYFDTRTPSFQTTIRHARLHPGEYPLFSSQVAGPAEYMEDPDNSPILIENETEGRNERLISWNIKGNPCEDIREHNEPFYATENRGLITIICDRVDFFYVLYYLREHLKSLGGFSRSNEAHAGKVKRVKIRVPIDEKGDIDLARQEEIARNYEEIIKLRGDMNDRISTLKELVTDIDVFK